MSNVDEAALGSGWSRCGVESSQTARRGFTDRLAKELDSRGTVDVLRHGVVDLGVRISWAAVRNAIIQVVDDQLDDSRLDGLFRIGVDEISYRKAHRYLTVVADHDRDGAVIWAGEGHDGASGKDSATLARFYDELGPEQAEQLQAVSLDLGKAYAKATREHAPQAHGGSTEFRYGEP